MNRDGVYHRNNLLQKHRDELKNSILAKADLALSRLPTTGSGEKDLIINSIIARLQKILNIIKSISNKTMASTGQKNIKKNILALMS